MDDISADVEKDMNAVEQLITSVQSSTRSAKRVVARRKSDKQKADTDYKQKDAVARRKELEQEADRVKAMALFKTSTAIFFLDWAALGHKAVPLYEKKVDLAAAVQEGLLALPFRVAAGCEGLNAVATDPNGKGDGTLMPQWQQAIQEPLVTLNQADAVSHILSEQEGVTQIADALAGIVEGHPWVKADLAFLKLSPVLFGYGPTYVRFDFNENYLGAIRVVSNGTMKFLFMNPSATAQWLSENPAALELAGGEQEITLSTHTKYFHNLTEQEANHIKDKVEIFWCTVSAGELICQPPG